MRIRLSTRGCGTGSLGRNAKTISNAIIASNIFTLISIYNYVLLKPAELAVPNSHDDGFTKNRTLPTLQYSVDRIL